MSSPIAASGTSPAFAEQPRPADQPAVQASLTERFNILKFLGTSGNSFCFAALDLKTQRHVRLKVLSDDAAIDRVQRELFYLEAAAAAKLSHQNITRTTEAEELGGIHFCTIEQSPNAESLRDLLDIRSWLEVDVAVSIALQVADALDYAHRMGVLHLKLAPANILIEADGRVLVTDFGVGAQQELAWAHTDRSGRHGAQYTSPEQIQGSNADPRSDLYSLGIILFEMLTDRVPFDSPDAGLVKRKQLAQAPHPPQLFRHGVSNYLSALVLTLLEKNPDWRFQTGAQLQTALSKVAPVDLAENDDEGFPLPKPLSVEEQGQSAELDSAEIDSIEPQSIDPLTDSGAYNADDDVTFSPPNDAEATYTEATYTEATYTAVTHREFFEPPTIIKIDPPARRVSERKGGVEPSPAISIARKRTDPFSLYAASNRSQSRKQALAFLAIMLVILLLISLLGGNYLVGLFLTANDGEQNNLPDAVDGTHITNPEPANSDAVLPGPAEQMIVPETQDAVIPPGMDATTGPLPDKERVTSPRRRYVRRPAYRKVRQSARRKFRARRNTRKSVYLRRARGWAQPFDLSDRLKLRES